MVSNLPRERWINKYFTIIFGDLRQARITARPGYYCILIPFPTHLRRITIWYDLVRYCTGRDAQHSHRISQINFGKVGMSEAGWSRYLSHVLPTKLQLGSHFWHIALYLTVPFAYYFAFVNMFWHVLCPTRFLVELIRYDPLLIVAALLWVTLTMSMGTGHINYNVFKMKWIRPNVLAGLKIFRIVSHSSIFVCY